MKTLRSLNKIELIHLMDSGICDIAGLERTRAMQKEMQRKENSSVEPCWECKMISRKLGLEE